MRRNHLFAVPVAVSLLVCLNGCGLKNGGIELGPVAVTLPVASGSFDASAFSQAQSLPLVTGVIEQDLCSLPTEDDLTQVFRQAGNIDLSGAVKLSRVQLRKTTLHATSGDFHNVKAVQAYFIPKNGSIFGIVNLGGAFSLTGFGDTIEIKPPKSVDLLELIQENDAMVSADCPKLRVRVTGTVPDQAISWEAEIDADAYAFLGIF